MKDLRDAFSLTGKSWNAGAHRAAFYVCAVCLSLYLSFALFLSQSMIFTSALATAFSLAWGLLIAAALYMALLFACRRLSNHARRARETRARLSPRFFLWSAAASFSVLLVWFLACYPGATSYDVLVQWTQVQTGRYDNWHPVFHTLLMWLGTRPLNAYQALVLMQLAAYALAAAWLSATLRAWGLPGWLLLLEQTLVTAVPIVGNTLMFIWKDDALTIAATLLTAQLVNIRFTGGAWLKRPRNAVALGLLLAVAALVRHNGFLYALPLLITLIACYRRQRKALLIATTVCLCFVGLVTGPLYAAIGVSYPDSTLEESVGVPMTMLFDVRQQNPDALDAETAAYLALLVPEDTFRTHYSQNSFNSVKFVDSLYAREELVRLPVDKLLRMTLSTIRGDPRNAFLSYCGLTDLVWGLRDAGEGVVSTSMAADNGIVSYTRKGLNAFFTSVKTALAAPLRLLPIRWLFENIGVQLALLLLAGLLALYRDGTGALALCVPTLLYAMGTMLLLCGNDARFFQFCVALAPPSVLALCYANDAARACQSGRGYATIGGVKGG